MNTDFLVDEDELGILSQKRIKREIKTYNRALLFNRKELDSLRQKGLETIRRFSEGKVKLDGNISGLCTYDECDLMDSYIKIFGRNNDDIRKNAYVELNRIAPVQHGRHRKSFVPVWDACDSGRQEGQHPLRCPSFCTSLCLRWFRRPIR